MSNEIPEFTQGVCEDGAAILIDSQPLSIEQILDRLRSGEKANRVAIEMWEMFYGQNLHVVGWHLNGDYEPIDSFFESNDWNIDSAESKISHS